MRKKALMELSGDNVQRIDALKKQVKGNTRVDVALVKLNEHGETRLNKILSYE